MYKRCQWFAQADLEEAAHQIDLDNDSDGQLDFQSDDSTKNPDFVLDPASIWVI